MKPRFKLYRKMRENQIIMKDQSSLAIWVYLLLNAMDQPMDSIFNNEIIKLQPWQLITSRKRISIDLNINESKVQRELQMFEKWTMIEQQTNTQNRLITIVNWSNYQDCEQRTNDGWTTNEHNNKIKNKIENIESIDSKESISSTPYGVITPSGLQNEKGGDIMPPPPTPSIRDDINQIIWLIKSTCMENGIVYNPVDERNFGKHILSKKFAEVAHWFWMDTMEFVKNIILISVQDSFRWGKIDGPKSIYQKYPHVLNNAKNKFQSSKRADLSLL